MRGRAAWIPVLSRLVAVTVVTIVAILPPPAGRRLVAADATVGPDSREAAGGVGGITVEKSQAGGAVVMAAGRPFATYVIDQANKPFLWPIHGPTGREMTRAYPMRDAPGEAKDHPHHRGLTFGHQGINGSDTWAEEATYLESPTLRDRVGIVGRIRHREYRRLAGGKTGVIHAASDLLDPAGRHLLDVESRFTFASHATSRTIDVDIDLVARGEAVTVQDMKDAGMFIRVPHDMAVDTKQGGRIVTSEGRADAEAWGTRAAWCDYHGPVGGERLGIAILDHPDSFRHPTAWHVRTYGLFAANPFGPQFFDPSAATGTMQLEPGARIRLRHRVVLHVGDEKQGGVGEAYKAYASQPRPPL